MIISHDHYDHLDHPAILELVRREVPFITSLGVGAHLVAWGVPEARITELDWWEHAELARGGVTVTAAPAQHFSGGGWEIAMRRCGLPWSCAVPSTRYFLAAIPDLLRSIREIRQRLGPFDLVMLEVGAFHPSWGEIHLGPENALAALALLGGGAFLPVHWGTFNLAIHAWDEPAETLLQLAPKGRVQLVMPQLGEAVEPVRVEGVDPWWRPIAALHKDCAHAHADSHEAESHLLEPID